jgi:hypothetical protein
MSGPTGPTGPNGPIGYVGYGGYTGPQGITGVKGYNGKRGYPGRPSIPICTQIFKSSADLVVAAAGSSATYVFDLTNLCAPALSGSNSVTISGLTASNSASATSVTFPVGQYYVQAASTINSNILNNPSSQYRAQAYLTLTDSTTPSTIYLQGLMSVSANTLYMVGQFGVTSPVSANLRMNVFGTAMSSQYTFNPTYTQGNFSSGAPSSAPPNVTMTIMKIV